MNENTIDALTEVGGIQRPELRAESPVPIKILKLTPQDIIDNGILWMINKSIFHPQGYALALSTDTGNFELFGNGDEPWSFAGVAEDAKLQAFRDVLAEVTVERPQEV